MQVDAHRLALHLWPGEPRPDVPEPGPLPASCSMQPEPAPGAVGRSDIVEVPVTAPDGPKPPRKRQKRGQAGVAAAAPLAWSGARVRSTAAAVVVETGVGVRGGISARVADAEGEAEVAAERGGCGTVGSLAMSGAGRRDRWGRGLMKGSNLAAGGGVGLASDEEPMQGAEEPDNGALHRLGRVQGGWEEDVGEMEVEVGVKNEDCTQQGREEEQGGVQLKSKRRRLQQSRASGQEWQKKKQEQQRNAPRWEDVFSTGDGTEGAEMQQEEQGPGQQQQQQRGQRYRARSLGELWRAEDEEGEDELQIEPEQQVQQPQTQQQQQQQQQEGHLLRSSSGRVGSWFRAGKAGLGARSRAVAGEGDSKAVKIYNMVSVAVGLAGTCNEVE